MVTGGNVTVFISSMDRAVQFYTETMGLRLAERYGNDWATVQAGNGFTIGLHPPSPKYAAPGTKGGMMIGLEVDESVEGLMKTLGEKGVRIPGGIEAGAGGKFLHIEDPDGNEIYLWEMQKEVQPQSR
jgi:catechol 2,3-dioxygenase-like lactoylglutathione lyase family enzyme